MGHHGPIAQAYRDLIPDISRRVGLLDRHFRTNHIREFPVGLPPHTDLEGPAIFRAHQQHHFTQRVCLLFRFMRRVRLIFRRLDQPHHGGIAKVLAPEAGHLGEHGHLRLPAERVRRGPCHVHPAEQAVGLAVSLLSLLSGSLADQPFRFHGLLEDHLEIGRRDVGC